MLAGLLMLAAVAGVVPQGAPTRYRIDLKSSTEMDLTAMGMGKQAGELVASAWITVTMTDTTGGQVAHVQIDSMTGTPTGMAAQQLSPDVFTSAKGTFVHFVIVDGKIQGTPKASAESPGGNMVAQALPLLFAGNKPGLKIGDVWTDTTKTDSQNETMSQTGNNVTAWKATSADGDAIVIEGSLAGAANAKQGDADIVIKSSGTQKVTTLGKGPAKSVSATLKNEMVVVTPQAPDPIPVTAMNAITFTTIP